MNDAPIPHDLFATAFSILSTIQMDHAGKFESWDGDASLKLIAEALMAEREACAKIAEDEDGHFSHFGEDRNSRVAQAVCRDAAAAIRKGSS